MYSDLTQCNELTAGDASRAWILKIRSASWISQNIGILSFFDNTGGCDMQLPLDYMVHQGAPLKGGNFEFEYWMHTGCACACGVVVVGWLPCTGDLLGAE